MAYFLHAEYRQGQRLPANDAKPSLGMFEGVGVQRHTPLTSPTPRTAIPSGRTSARSFSCSGDCSSSSWHSGVEMRAPHSGWGQNMGKLCPASLSLR